ncbi:hypothetical protein TURU_024427 [Turdus rufiventris]|nr:hypothetical protein TURU_024427 [Turdus rufiventris]
MPPKVIKDDEFSDHKSSKVSLNGTGWRCKVTVWVLRGPASLRCVYEALAPDSELQSPWGDWVSGNQSKMSHITRAPRHFVLSSSPNGAPEEETYSNLQTIPDTTEQMEFDISSATQVGHQLALIGDEFNRRYHGRLGETLLHLARVVAFSVFQTWNVTKSITRSFGDVVSSNWTKRITGYGGWPEISHVKTEAAAQIPHNFQGSVQRGSTCHYQMLEGSPWGDEQSCCQWDLPREERRIV